MRLRAVRALALTAWLGLHIGVAGLDAQSQDRVADAENALRTGRYDDAVSLFADIVRRQPESARAAQGMVESSAAVGRYGDAEEAARRYNRSNPESPQLLNALGEVLALRGKLDAAEDAFARAID
jgi:predicted Zn-dependent protease